MKVGKTLRFIPSGRGWKVEGRVVWVHPRGRFAVVEYRAVTMRGRLSEPIRESVQLVHGVPDRGCARRNVGIKKKGI